MSYRRTLTALLLTLTLGATLAFVFAAAIPGTWWQWLAIAAVLLIAAACASNAADDKERP